MPQFVSAETALKEVLWPPRVCPLNSGDPATTGESHGAKGS